MERVILSLEKKRYILSIDYGDRISNESEIRPYDHKPIDGHFLIEKLGYRGGGMGGWDERSELIGIAHGKDELPERLYECALFQGKKLAELLDAEFVNNTQERALSKKSDLATKVA
jgi:hypothetical protein